MKRRNHGLSEKEMEEHLGYEKNSVAGNNTGNSRNGYGTKTIRSEYGECEIAVPRDRDGEFEPQVIEKRQTRTDEIEQKIMAMYAKGMSQRDIESSTNVSTRYSGSTWTGRRRFWAPESQKKNQPASMQASVQT